MRALVASQLVVTARSRTGRGTNMSENTNQQDLHDLIVDVLDLSPMSDPDVRTSMADIDQTADELIEKLGLSFEWDVTVPALGDTPSDPGTLGDEETARSLFHEGNKHWDYGNPRALYRRVVGDWSLVEKGE